jgi:hypothetical protein
VISVRVSDLSSPRNITDECAKPRIEIYLFPIDQDTEAVVSSLDMERPPSSKIIDDLS